MQNIIIIIIIIATTCLASVREELWTVGHPVARSVVQQPDAAEFM